MQKCYGPGHDHLRLDVCGLTAMAGCAARRGLGDEKVTSFGGFSVWMYCLLPPYAASRIYARLKNHVLRGAQSTHQRCGRQTTFGLLAHARKVARRKVAKTRVVGRVVLERLSPALSPMSEAPKPPPPGDTILARFRQLKGRQRVLLGVIGMVLSASGLWFTDKPGKPEPPPHEIAGRLHARVVGTDSPPQERSSR